MSEYFPPAVGGSAELLANTYGRLGSGIAVLTASVGASTAAPLPSMLPTFRMGFPPGIGLMAPTSLVGLARLAARINRLSPSGTVVHCGRALPEGTAAWLNWLVTRRPYACWTHGEELPITASSRELSWLSRKVHLGASALLANSHNTARLLRALGNPDDKIHVIHPGVDSERFKPEVEGAAAVRRTLAREGEVLLLSVGRLQARKGHDLVLRALAGPFLHNRSVRYLIVGTGPERTRLEALATRLGIADRVRFVGAVSGEALPAYYAAVDIFVHPNRVEGEDFEGFGMVFLEAAAAELPAIGGRSGGVPEAIEEGTTGLLVSGTDPGELGAAILQLMESVPTRRQLGAAARARVLRDFTWERAANQLREIDAAMRR